MKIFIRPGAILYIFGSSELNESDHAVATVEERTYRRPGIRPTYSRPGSIDYVVSISFIYMES